LAFKAFAIAWIFSTNHLLLQEDYNIIIGILRNKAKARGRIRKGID
jgi:hypothetical protein